MRISDWSSDVCSSDLRELAARGFENLVDWTRGVDTALFRPDAPKAQALLGLPRPIHLYVGRVAVEKNIRAFLELALPGSKVVVGDGPQRAELQAAFPEVVFVGAKHGEELADRKSTRLNSSH